MENRLLFIAVAMGVYVLATRKWSAKGFLNSRKATAIWHALFYLLAGWGVTLVLVLSVESRVGFVTANPNTLTFKELFTGFIGGLLAACWGYWSAWSKGKSAKERKYFVDEDLEWGETVFSAVVLAWVLMSFVVQAFKIPSGSMLNTLRIGDHLFVNKFIYGVVIPFTEKRVFPIKPVKRGDIMVFRFPTDDPEEFHCGSAQHGKDFIKRVIALPGETVEIRGGEVFIDGKTLGAEPYTVFQNDYRYPPPRVRIGEEVYQDLWTSRRLDERLGDTMKDHFGPVEVPEDSYFVMGDNRDASCDGRFWGPVHKKYVKGRAWIIYWPPGRMGGIS